MGSVRINTTLSAELYKLAKDMNISFAKALARGIIVLNTEPVETNPDELIEETYQCQVKKLERSIQLMQETIFKLQEEK